MRRAAQALVVALTLLGVGVASWPFVQHWQSGRDTAVAQKQLRSELVGKAPRPTPDDRRQPGREQPVASPAAPGKAVATMTIPRLGRDWSWVVVEGTTDEQLALGPGHYPRTPLPGGRGNVAIAGHRAGHGDPFLDFDTLRPGDEVRFEQAGTTWTYELTTDPEIIPVSADWVLDPLRGRALTLTTCWPKYGSSKRMFVRGELVDVATSTSEALQASAQGA